MNPAFEAAKKKWLPRPDVNGVFLARRKKGKEWTDEICLQIHVKKKLPKDALTKAQLIPKTIKGVATDVLETNPVLSIGGGKWSAVQGGHSIGIEEQTDAGTLGLVMLAGTPPVPVGVTCAHVLLVRGAGSPTLGDFVIHPAQDDAGRIIRDRIGVPLSQILVSSSRDIAYFSVDYPYGLSVLDTNVIPTNAADPVINDVLEKVGRTTGWTTGQVAGSGNISFDYTEYGAGVISVPVVFMIPLDTDDPGTIIADAGDSGALWYFPNTQDAGGIHTGHDTVDNIAYAGYFVPPASPMIPLEYFKDYKGSANFAIQNVFDSKGAMNLSGASSPFVSRLTVVNQDTTEVQYPAITDIYAAAGIQFIVPGSSPVPPEEVTLPVWSDLPVVWNDYPNAWGDYGGESGSGVAIVVPTYISSNSFSVPLDVASDYPEGRKLKLIQGTDAVVAVVSAAYAGGITTVVVDPASVQSDVVQIKFAPIIPDSLPIHFHPQIQDNFAQASHGFSALTAIYRKSDSTWAKAKADALATAEAVGIVESVSGNDFTVIFSGLIKNQIDLTPGASYFISAVTAGLLVTEEPDANIAVSKPMMIAITTTTGVINNMRGLELAS
jgi:hypothetical protein